jgi:hypothetical protein
MVINSLAFSLPRFLACQDLTDLIMFSGQDPAVLTAGLREGVVVTRISYCQASWVFAKIRISLSTIFFQRPNSIKEETQ